jgi:nickel/cobalt exporter
MNEQAIVISAGAAVASIAFFHTITGPDHYLPFIMIGRARKWSTLKTSMLTMACGLGHVFSSILLAMVAIFCGSMLTKVKWIEESRGELAAWMLVAFGLFYMVWGVKQAYKNREHKHVHDHGDGHKHEHEHCHQNTHSHFHVEDKKKITPWVLFIIFVLGPCEPMIPLLIAPASKGSIAGVIWVAVIFTVVTLGTMLGLVLSSIYGLKKISFKPIEKYSHAFAGASILCCGIAMQFLGL